MVLCLHKARWGVHRQFLSSFLPVVCAGNRNLNVVHCAWNVCAALKAWKTVLPRWPTELSSRNLKAFEENKMAMELMRKFAYIRESTYTMSATADPQ
jgi:hypothetical protein